MNKKDFIAHRKEIEAHVNGEFYDLGYEITESLISELFKEKDYTHIAEVYNWPFLDNKEMLDLFEVAYSLVELGKQKEAEKVYENILKNDPLNTSVLNNLSNLKQTRGEIGEAWDLISKAYELKPKDEIISRNYNNLSSIVQEIRQTEDFFKSAIPTLQRENEFVLDKLKLFVLNSKKDPDFKNNTIPIPRWKFKVLIQTDEQKALSLVDQWLEKGYIRRTGDRGNYNEHIYQINPYLESGFKAVKTTKLPEKWILGIEKLNADEMSNLEYFQVVDLLHKVRKKYRILLERDVDELYLNYIMGNNKAVIVLAGSLVETLLIYYCEKKKVTTISYSRNQKQINKKLYDADLGDLLSFFQEQKILSDILVHMGNLSRISRNFIHPGKELRDTEELNPAKANLCFISSIEIVKLVCTRAT